MSFQFKGNEVAFNIFLDEIQSADSVQGVWLACADLLASYGFTYITYLMVRLDMPHDNPIALTTMPRFWSDHYLSFDHVSADPLFRFCGNLKSRRTGIDYIDTYPILSKEERERVVTAGDAGCRTGFSSPVRLLGSRRCGGWNFGSHLPKKEFEKLLPLIEEQVRLIGFCAHERIEAMHQLSTQTDNESTILSPREQECLSFLAQGSRTSCIARLLGISAATVEFHMKNTRRKLGASTREEAIAKAISLGHITLPA